MSGKADLIWGCIDAMIELIRKSVKREGKRIDPIFKKNTLKLLFIPDHSERRMERQDECGTLTVFQLQFTVQLIRQQVDQFQTETLVGFQIER